MLTTHYALLTGFVELLEYARPTSILDLAVGYGKWGFLCRDYLDVTTCGNRLKNDRQLRLDGIESDAAIIQDHQQSIYDNIHIGNVWDTIDKLGAYDLIVLGDALDHIEKDKGRQLLEKCISHANASVIVLTKLSPPQITDFSTDNGNSEDQNAWKAEELNGYSSQHAIYQSAAGEFGAFLIDKNKYIDQRIIALKEEAFVPVLPEKVQSLRSRYQLNHDLIGAIDLSQLADSIPNDEFRDYFLDNSYREHYRLLACLSMRFSGQTLFDIGTLKGYSALALSFNPENNVISYDIKDLKELRDQDQLKTIDYRIGNVFDDPVLLSSPLVLLDTYHEGTFEREFYAHLKKNQFKGLLVLDDIFFNDAMKAFWNDIDLPKEDITDLGHWSGTGIVDFG